MLNGVISNLKVIGSVETRMVGGVTNTLINVQYVLRLRKSLISLG